MEQFPAKNPNPVISVGKNGVVLYSNSAGESLLCEWDVKIGEKVPSYIGDFVQKVTSQNSPEKMEVKVGKKTYLVAFHPLPEDKCVNIYGFDISDQKELEKKLLESEERERARSNELATVLDAVPVAVYIAHDSQVLQLTGNRLSYEWQSVPAGTNFSKSAPEEERPEMFKLFKNGVEIPPEKMPSQMAATGVEVNNCELDIVSSDGKIRHVLGNARPLLDEQGNPRGSVSAFIDITERKKAEEALKKVHESLEEKVKERTIQLEKAYNSLKESENSLAEAQRMAHIGNWEWNLVTGEVSWSGELYRIFERSPQEPGATYDEFLSYVHPDDRDYVNNTVKKSLNGEPVAGDYRIILANGEERIVHSQVRVTFDETNSPVRVRGIVQDITERKKAEETLENITIIRKKEIHHRIKNNLQVISSLLDLQAEKFNNRECIKDSEVLEAFRESQERVMSIAFIHEELHEGRGDDALNFSLYLQRLLQNLFQTYRSGNIEICLDLDLGKNIFFDMDIAVPLGMIINEIISNSFKYAFPNRHKGIVQIKLFKEEKIGNEMNNFGEKLSGKGTRYTLIVSDDGIGISEKTDFENSETLGLQLVNTLVNQLDGELELKRDNGTKFTIRFTVT